MNAKYKIWIEDEDICVGFHGMARVTRHPKSEKFSINLKRIRKITFTTSAISLFEKFQADKTTQKYTLVDIQNALTILRLTYQDLTENNVLKKCKDFDKERN